MDAKVQSSLGARPREDHSERMRRLRGGRSSVVWSFSWAAWSHRSALQRHARASITPRSEARPPVADHGPISAGIAPIAAMSPAQPQQQIAGENRAITARPMPQWWASSYPITVLRIP